MIMNEPDRKVKFQEFINSLEKETSQQDIEKYWNIYHCWNYISDLKITQKNNQEENA